jgi:hypothetical protein
MPDQIDAKKDGYIYVLISQNSPYVKIGGTALSPMKRIKEINNTEPYKSLGPWALGTSYSVTN